ncbi:MAG: HEAT repeat domain-containing protein [Bacteroidales bacterium]|nr:HEAT repeat domain-containing protein [Bacteroidales bacterium]
MKTNEIHETGIKEEKLQPEVRALLNDLMSGNTIKRKEARHWLESQGEDVLDDLHYLLRAKDHQLRWEAAKALEDIASSKSIPVFIKLMHNHETEFRWMAAEGLRKIGKESIPAVLELVENSGQSVHIRQGAHHVLNALYSEQEKLEQKNLMDALSNSNELGETAPVWAEEALERLSKRIV